MPNSLSVGSVGAPEHISWAVSSLLSHGASPAPVPFGAAPGAAPWPGGQQLTLCPGGGDVLGLGPKGEGGAQMSAFVLEH